jgi:transcriptional antiterminator
LIEIQICSNPNKPFLGGLFGNISLLKYMPPQLLIGVADSEEFKNKYDRTCRHIYSHKDIFVKLGQETLSEDDIRRLRKQIKQELQDDSFSPQVKVELAKSYNLLSLVAGNTLGQMEQLQKLQNDESPGLTA